MRKYLIACLFMMAVSRLFAQTIDYAAGKEKVYMHTNHVFFTPGETMFFKLYVVKAKDNTPSWVSPVVYTEIISPVGTIVQTMKYAVTDGYAEGSYDFDASAKGGIYKLRCYTTWMRNEGDSSFFTKEITVQNVIPPRVLLRLDFPEKGYGPGSDVVADFSMRNLSDEPIKFRAAQFSVSVGGKVASNASVTTDKEGKAKIRFRLPQDLSSSDGLLNVTVNYDSYTEAISRSIPITLNNVDLQFMPEGGRLVAGLSSWVAFRAVNEWGKPVDLKGNIYDQYGNVVASLESFYGGMGRFTLTPAAGQHYFARITAPAGISRTYSIPDALPSGIVMHVAKQQGKLTVQLSSTQNTSVQLVGESKGQDYYTQPLELHSGKNEVVLDETHFPIGITRFTVYSQDVPVAERLIFLNEQRGLKVQVTTDKQRYLPREKVALHITTLDEQGKPVPANLSLSVVDDQLWTFADDKQDHLLSWLLMSSELHGRIDEPQFYFKKDEPKATAALDLVMLTHGYRYFDYVADAGPGNLRFPPDQMRMVSGIVQDANGHPLKATVFILEGDNRMRVLNSNTDSTGAFFFSGLQTNTKYYLLAQAADGKRQAFINITQKGVGYNPFYNQSFKLRRDDNILSVVAEPRSLKGMGIERKAAEMPYSASALQEVVVIGYGAQLRKDITGSISVIRPNDIVAMAHVQQALQGRIAGISITVPASELNKSVIAIRGIASVNNNNAPLIVLDGVVLDQVNLNNLNTVDIDDITIVKDAAAVALYGSRAANGIVVINSKKYRHERIRINLGKPFIYAAQQVSLDGTSYSVARRFYAPLYTEVDVEKKEDFRSSIYWNPTVQTDENGKADVEFYNSDASTTFRIIAEGIGYQGLLGRSEQTYSVKNALGLDVKIPPYLTVGDGALLPLVLRNNRSEEVSLSISVKLPANMQAGSYPATVKIPADTSVRILIPVSATAAVKGLIGFVVEGSGRRQSISLPIEASEKGFPVSLSCAASRDAKHEFRIEKPVPGSVKARAKVFRDVEGQLLDGIESMLHEPYGCFEQTSSSTYPNIYVLKYLKESGRLNPEVEKKAMAYIKAGYKKLIGFETSEHGFEWFGHAPAHESLTAYGLLEFTDMREFIDVDADMLARTKKFLLDRRDGQGSFKLANSGYDRFASVPNKIANLYIVYALTQAGVRQEIEPEYTAAVNKALESKDAYQLSLMALAASNMKNEKDFRTLMDALNGLQLSGRLNAETSVVNSREQSLRVETMSLYALALMRESSPDLVKIANLLSEIMLSKSYYGYGATQATVLALQAVVAYSKLRGRISEQTDIRFTLNGQTVSGDDQVLAALKEGKNNLDVSYGPGTENVPYEVQVSYNTLTPPNDAAAELQLSTKLSGNTAKLGETVRMDITVRNTRNGLQPMAVAKIGIPAGLSMQPWQLKEILERNEIAYYEIFDNYLVFYWMGFAPSETKTLHLDLKADVPGRYMAKASNVYLYYTPEHKHWNEGTEISIEEPQVKAESTGSK